VAALGRSRRRHRSRGSTAGILALSALAVVTGGWVSLSNDSRGHRQATMPAAVDREGDGDEETRGTDRYDRDTDGDGITDGDEVNDFGTDPTDPDRDADGIIDPVELEIGTDPDSADTDADGISDLSEFDYGTDPLDPDTDDDSYDDRREVVVSFTDPLNPHSTP
jgi:hypothetical protein